MKGRISSEPIRLAVKHADAGGAVELVAGHDVPVAIDVLDIDRHVDGALAAVDQHRDAALMGDAADLLDRNDRAQRIRHMGDRHQLGAIASGI